MKLLTRIFKKSLLTMANISLLLLTSLIIYSIYTNDVKKMLFVILLIFIGRFYENYQAHHIIPVMAFYSFNILQEWFQILLENSTILFY